MEDHPCLSALLETILGIQESDGLPAKEDWRRLREKAKQYQRKIQHETVRSNLINRYIAEVMQHESEEMKKVWADYLSV